MWRVGWLTIRRKKHTAWPKRAREQVGRTLTDTGVKAILAAAKSGMAGVGVRGPEGLATAGGNFVNG